MRTAAALSIFATSIACAGTTADPEPSAAPVEAPAVASPAQPSAAVPVAANPPATPPASDELAPLLREVASAYRSWGMVDDQFHWAPGLCAMPASGVAHYSTAQQPAAHAEKVFLLYAIDPMGYWKAAGEKGRLPRSLAEKRQLSARSDVLQVLVKESFAPAKLGEGGSFHVGVRPAKKGDESFAAGEPIGLFVMAQLDGKPAGTDDGWIYATVAPDGSVTNSGAIAACQECHAKEADRVFGVPLQWK